MRKYIVLLLITGTVWAQTGLDKLVLKDGSTHKGTGIEYLGEYSKMELATVYFKPQGASGFQPVPVKSIHTLQLKDGRILIDYGSINRKTYLNSLEYEKLTIEQKATYDELRKRHKRQIITCSFIILILVPLVFIIGDGNRSGTTKGGGKVFLGDGPPT